MLNKGKELQGRYVVERQLGEGGMGVVYEAFDKRLNSRVAIKETLTNDENFIRAFRKEAQLLANLNHPSLPRVIDHFSEGDGHYLVMDYVDGDDLNAFLVSNPNGFPFENVIFLANQLLEVLQYLHSQPTPIIHRDIKPANLKVKDNRVYLLDFGLAIGTAGGMSLAFQHKGLSGYTPNFAPIEQVQGLPTTPASDFYSLGATLFQLLSGKMPNDALERAISISSGKTDPLPNIKQLKPDLNNVFADGLNKALSLNASERPQTVNEMRRQLFMNTSSPTLVQSDTIQKTTVADWQHRQSAAAFNSVGGQSQPAAKKRSKLPIILAALFCVFLIGGIAVLGGIVLFVTKGGSFFEDKRATATRLSIEAEEFLVAGKYEKAIETSKKAIETDPSYAPSYVTYGDACWDTIYQDVINDSERIESNKSAEKILELIIMPKNAEEYMSVAWAHLAKGESDRAIDNASKAIALKENYAMAYAIRGGAYSYKIGTVPAAEEKAIIKRAIDDYDEAIRLRPNYAQGYMLRADLFITTKEFTKAISDATEAIRLLPQARFYRKRGDAYWFSKKYENARKEYEEAVKINPRYRKGYIGLGDSLSFLNKYKDAIAAYQKANEIDPNDSYVHYSIGNNYFSLKMYDEAVDAFSIAIRLKPTDYFSYQARGDSYQQLRKPDLAKTDWDMAKKLRQQAEVK